MGTSYRDCNPEQPCLLPPSPRDWLPENHLACFICDTLEQFDLSGLDVRYQGDRRRIALPSRDDAQAAGLRLRDGRVPFA